MQHQRVARARARARAARYAALVQSATAPLQTVIHENSSCYCYTPSAPPPTHTHPAKYHLQPKQQVLDEKCVVLVSAAHNKELIEVLPFDLGGGALPPPLSPCFWPLPGHQKRGGKNIYESM